MTTAPVVMNTGAVFMMAARIHQERAMQDDLSNRLQAIKAQTVAEHLRKAARDLAVMGSACGLAAIFWREALPEGVALWLAAALPVGGLLYVAASFYESQVRRRSR